MGAKATGLSRAVQTPAEFADLIELSILSQSRSVFSIDKIRDMFPDYLHVDEIAIGLALEEMRRRHAILGDKYPFDVTNSRVLPIDTPSVYKFLLATSFGSLSEDARSEHQVPIAKRFEELVEFCVSTFFGDRTQIVNFGFPSLNGRPSNFPEAIEWLAAQMGINSGQAYRSPRRQDGGVDLVVWRTFDDRKPGIPIVLVQATIQQDLVAKSRDIDLRLWSGWLSMDVDPIMALASPHVISNIEVWNEISRNCLLFDRVRLTQLSSITFEPEAVDQPNLDRVLAEIVNLG